MIVNISQASLSKAAAKVVKGVGKDSVLPILGGMRLDAADGTLSIRSNDMNVSIRATVAANVEERGSTVVPGKVFESIVKGLPDQAVSIVTDGQYAVVSCGRTKYRLHTLNPDDFPAFPELEADSTVELPASTLSEMVSKVVRCVSKDTSRPVLNGVQVSVDGGILRLVATDSYRLAVCDANVGTESGFEAVIPGDSLRDVLKMADPAGIVEVGETKNQVCFRIGTTEYVTRRIEGNYPNYRQIIPAASKVTARIDVDLMSTALKRVSVLAKDDPSLVINLGEHSMTLLARSQQHGESTEEVDVDSDGSMAFSVNARYLADGLDGAGDEATLELVSAMSPVVIKSYGTTNYLYLLMPVRM